MDLYQLIVTRTIALVSLLAMFAVSGIGKVAKLGYTQTRQFTDVFGMPLWLAVAIVFLAGVWECAAVGAIAYGEVTHEHTFVRQGVLALLVFTVLATLLFKVYPRFKTIQVMSNLSVFGGLLLYYLCIQSQE